MALPYKLQYVSPAIVRAEDEECCLIYKDDRGNIYLYGFTDQHSSGGLLYFPSQEEWDRLYPQRKGQRNLIKGRVLEYVRLDRWLRCFERSLTDETFCSRHLYAVSKLRPRLPPERRPSLLERIMSTIEGKWQR
jgi:hypothetical protein